MKKRILGLTMVLVMLCAFMPCVATAKTSGTCGDNVTWVLDDNGTLTISGTGEIEILYSEIGMETPWGYQNTNIKKLVIEEGVTSICYEAFEGCSNLSEITIADSVINVGSGAFYNTAWLNNQNEGAIYVGQVLYQYKGTVPDNASFKIKDDTKAICGSAFYNQTGLTKITMPDSIKNIGDCAFMYCSNLSEIEMSSNIEYIGPDAFFGTEYYNNYPDDVIYLGNWILDCKSDTAEWSVSEKKDAALTLTSVTVKDGTVGIAEEAFLPGLMAMFKSVLENVSLPDSLKYICDGAFLRCEKLTDIYYSGTEEEWESIFIDENNDELLNATIHFAQIEPTPSPAPEPCFTVTDGTITNTSGTEQSATVIIAAYGADGALTNVNAETVTFSADEKKTFTVPPNGKIFVWNSLNGMYPLTK